ncbi:MAG TPA: hypothetical protein VHA13_01635 [Gammaproteobacteria bacterium]|nr:hypothetical protein [Gammaproteobacteria bacterium]
MDSTKDQIKHSTATDGKPPVGSSAFIHGVLQACEFLENKVDEPLLAANIIRDELVDAGLCSLKFAKSFSKNAGIRLNKVWKESCLRWLS